jgi:hypothetical protein
LEIVYATRRVAAVIYSHPNEHDMIRECHDVRSMLAFLQSLMYVLNFVGIGNKQHLGKFPAAIKFPKTTKGHSSGGPKFLKILVEPRGIEPLTS